MFPFELSLFGTGLMITVVVLVILYLVILIKLNPSTEGNRILEEPPTEGQVEPTIYNEVKDETLESIESQEPVSLAPVETKKTGVKGCSHYFGYLGEHPRNTSIPNECFTCVKIMECLLERE